MAIIVYGLVEMTGVAFMGKGGIELNALGRIFLIDINESNGSNESKLKPGIKVTVKELSIFNTFGILSVIGINSGNLFFL